MRKGLLAAATAALALLLAPAAGAIVIPVPQEPRSAGVPTFIGEPAQPRPIFSPDPPRHPHMAPNGRSNLHEDAFQSDVHQGPSPLGRDMFVRSNFLEGVCASITFDSRGRIVTICVGIEGPKLFLLDPVTLEQIAFFQLPGRQPGGTRVGGFFTDFAGGGYFVLDERDRALIPTTTRRLLVVEVGERGFSLVRDLDLSGELASSDKIISALPDWEGRPWFASINGVVGWVDPESGRVFKRDLGEPIGNSFAVDDEGSVYVVTTRALYRLDAGSDGPVIAWREEYETDGVQKSGQGTAGSGTTPTLMGDGLVAITDGADPINVVAYRRGREEDGPRKVCSVPVFERGASSTDQSLIGTRRSLIAENNHGYDGPSATLQGGVTSPGLERIDIDYDRGECRRVWRSEEASPSVVPKLSTSTGLVYTYTKTSQGDDPWYLTALDYETGRTVFKAFAGQGLGFNNNYAPITIGPEGTIYLGILGGIVSMTDAVPPQAHRPRPPRLSLGLSRSRRLGLRARVGGPDARTVERVDYFVGRRRVAREDWSPFRAQIRQRGLRRGRHRLRARILMLDGRTVERVRSFRRR